MYNQDSKDFPFHQTNQSKTKRKETNNLTLKSYVVLDYILDHGQLEKQFGEGRRERQELPTKPFNALCRNVSESSQLFPYHH